MPKLDTLPAPIIPPKIDPRYSDHARCRLGLGATFRDFTVWLTVFALTDFALAEAEHTHDAADLDAATTWLNPPD